MVNTGFYERYLVKDSFASVGTELIPYAQEHEGKSKAKPFLRKN